MSWHLVIGASGLIGEHILRVLLARGLEAKGTYFRHRRAGLVPLDIRDESAIIELLNHVRPDFVYFPAAIANVDYCEQNPDLTTEVNVKAGRLVLEHLGRSGTKSVFFSSDYVFDGRSGPYEESDTLSPICEYGRQKAELERTVAERDEQALVVRTTVVYGWESQGKNFVSRLLSKVRNGDTIRVPTDQVGTPTFAPNLADAVVELALADARGLVHIAGPTRVSRFEFAREAIRIGGMDQDLVLPVHTAELGQIAPRPLSAGLRVEKAQRSFGLRLLDYKTGLGQMLELRHEKARDGR